MVEDNYILEKELESFELKDVVITQFRGLAKKHFQLDILNKTDYLKLLKESSTFYSFSLPEEINEMFIKDEDAPLFWIYRSPIILYLEEFYKSTSAHTNEQNYYKVIKDFYTKWILNKNEDEKKYYASSALNFLGKRSNSHNILNVIFHAIILGFENNVLNVSKAIELLDKAKELVKEQNFNDNIKVELNYLVNLFQGFIKVKQNENESSLSHFSEALSVKPLGITAKFYHALNSSIIGVNPFDGESFNEFYLYDIARIEYTIDKNDLPMMNFFIKNAVFHNLFYYTKLSQSYTSAFDFLSEIKNTSEYDLNKLKADLINFKNLNTSEYLNEKNSAEISFIEKLFQSNFNSENIFFIGISSKLNRKFTLVIENIINSIKQKYYDGVKEKLQLFENELQYKITDLELLTRDHEGQKNRFKEKLNNVIKAIEKKAAENIAYFEERIESLNTELGYDPKITFKNAMTYNIILSFTTFLMGGCAEYSNTFMAETSKYSQFFPLVVLTGFKWGIIAFTIGLVISLITAGLSILEGSNQKQKLLQAINKIKDDKDYQKEYYRKEMERKEKESDIRFKESIEEKKKYIDKLKIEKDELEKKYLEDVEKNMEEETKPLLALIS